MERHRDQEIEEAGVPIKMYPFCHPFPKKGSQGGLSLVFPLMDSLLERAMISPQRSSHFKIFFSGQAIAAGMDFDFLGEKGGSTY
jgi:hypothetical protein